jgi:hypothetical protein
MAAPRGLSQPYRVLHRLLAPKHPPCTLCSLTTVLLPNGGDEVRSGSGAIGTVPCRSAARTGSLMPLTSIQFSRTRAPPGSQPAQHASGHGAVRGRPLRDTRAGTAVAGRWVGACEAASQGGPNVAAVRARGCPRDPSGRRPGYPQKGGDPAAGSPTATLLRLSPSHRSYRGRLRPYGSVSDFRYSRLPWLDGRCVQGSGTYSPWHS